MRATRIRQLAPLILLVLGLAACDLGQPPAATPAAQMTATPQPTQAPQGPQTPAAPSPAPATAAPTADEPLYLSIIWHQHQPVYYKEPQTGVYARPWVRLHAAKDYVDMAELAGRHPGVHVAFNLTPSLLRQLQDLEAGARDAYWLATETPAEQLSAEQKRFLLQRFFDVNPKIIERFPRYVELNGRRGAVDSDEQADSVATGWSAQDFRDLQVLFNLGWTDPDYLAQEPLKALVQQGRDFSEQQKATVLQRHAELIARVIPVHAELQRKGQIEITMTPYAHPILPLLFDTNQAREALPEIELPPLFRYGQDAQGQLERGVELYQQLFGQPPRGMWPGEGSVAQIMVTRVQQAGIRWMASDEEVLARSIGLNQFERNSAETVQQADQLYRPYYVKGAEQQPVAMVFRDRTISDKVGFTYSGMGGRQAADDFMQRMEAIRQQLAGKPGPHLVTVILDGENAWEHYPNDGKEFLTSLYEQLAASSTIKTVTPSEYLQQFPEQRSIEKLFAGSWINADFATWIGEPEENRAWELLGQSRETLQKYIGGQRKGSLPPETLDQALDLMYIAEGSDWFWWYGSDQESPDDGTFDQQFRSTLIQMHQVLGAEVPPELYVPIIPPRAAEPEVAAQSMVAPTVDGQAGADEWQGAGRYSVSGGVAQRADDVVKELYAGFGPGVLYLRLDARGSWADLGPQASLGLYLGSTKASATRPFSRFGAAGKTLLGFEAGQLIELQLANGTLQGQPQLSTVREGVWQEAAPQQGLSAALQGQTIELAVPLSLLGEIEEGDELRLRLVASRAEADIQLVPTQGAASLRVPDLGQTTTILSVSDPEGDDNGPGSYSYPTDVVFRPGAFDLTEFTVAEDQDTLIFRLKLRGKIENPWNSPRGMSVQTLDVYIDTGQGTARTLLPGRNAAVAEGGWDYAVWLEGWEGGLFQAQSDGPPEKVPGVEVKTVVDGPNGRISIRVPRSALPKGNLAQWRYQAAVLGQEGFPARGVWRVRDISRSAEQYRFGGALPGTNGTRIIDLALAEDAGVSQQQALTPPRPSQESNPDNLQPEDLAQVPMLTPR